MTILVMDTDGAIGHKSGSTVSGGEFSIVALQESTTVKVDGKGVYDDPLLYTFSNGNASGYVNGSVMTTAPQSIPATAEKVALDGKAPMRLGDWATMICEGVPSGGGDPEAVSGALVEVSDAGQDSTKAN